MKHNIFVDCVSENKNPKNAQILNFSAFWAEAETENIKVQTSRDIRIVKQENNKISVIFYGY